jgi:DNA-3-methyladenine glycosylase II
VARKGQADKMPPPIRTLEDLSAGIAALRQRDRRRIAGLLKVCGEVPLRIRPADFGSLLWIVVSQQVSTASAEAIHARVCLRFPALDPRTFAAASDDVLKACGLSTPKIRTLRAIAQAMDEGSLALASLAAMPVEEARAMLMAVKGIGPWTADLFLLSCLGHPDAWPAGDLALQEAMRLALGLDARPNAKEAEALAEGWRPWRGVAARILWAWYRQTRAKPVSGPTAGRA